MPRPSRHRLFRTARPWAVVARLGLALGGLWAGGVAGVGAAPAKAGQPTEYQVKAADLFALTKFTEWPAAVLPAEESLVFGVLGEDPFGGALRRLVQTKRWNGRSLKLMQVRGAEEAKACHVLFISRSERARLPAILAAVRDRGVLTVSELEGFTRAGGMIELYLQEGCVKFEINPTAAAAAGLRFSAQLLKSARLTAEPRGSR